MESKNQNTYKCNLEECNKKLQLTDFKCKCNNTYCSKHRLPETHKCTYDYKTSVVVNNPAGNRAIDSATCISNPTSTTTAPTGTPPAERP